MIIILILLLGFVAIFSGRWLFGRWYNHVSLYALEWAICLALFQSDLIRFYTPTMDTWAIIAAGCASFIIGSALVLGGRYALGNDMPNRSMQALAASEHSLFLKILWALALLTVIDALHNVDIVLKLTGSFSNFFVLGNLLYSVRVQEGLPGSIPYLGIINLVGSLLAGIYTSMVGKLKGVAFVIILSMLVSSIANMSRASIIIGAILFLSGLFLNTWRYASEPRKSLGLRVRTAITVAVLVALVVSGMEVVRSNRGTIERFSGATAALNKLGRSAGSFITPSVVWYISGSPAVLNQYLKKETENPGVGHYSLAPFWRILSKIGFPTYVGQHQPFYRTPIGSNVGTYLRELHADYGLVGVVMGPFLLGIIASVYWVRYMIRHSLLDLVVLAHVYVVVGMAIFTLSIQMGSWLGSLSASVIVSVVYAIGAQRLRPANTEILAV
jgi:oligosaccharide repeat unit polymerase